MQKVAQLVAVKGASFVADAIGVHYTCVHRWKSGKSGITKANVAAVRRLFAETFNGVQEEAKDPVQAVLDLATANPDKMRLRCEGLSIVGIDFVKEG